MERRDFLKYALFFAGTTLSSRLCDAMGVKSAGNMIDQKQAKQHPNIVFIMADDMGYGDVNHLNPDSKIPTPYMDALAAEGMYFTNAHSPSSVCTPTRYGVVTGRYSWRGRLKRGNIDGYDKLLIESGRQTVASILKDHGYRTGCIGKWHLGLTHQQPVDYSKPLTPGPNEVGFDYWFGIPASLDMPPYCYVENGLVTEPLTATLAKEPMPLFLRDGEASPGFDIDEVLPKTTDKACWFIEDHVTNHADKPFFLYFPMTAPHTPWLPLEENHQRSQAGMYGDFVTLVDDCVGQVMKTVEELGIKEDTLFIFTTDNGAKISYIGNHDNSVSDSSQHNFGHHANYIFRGQKSDVWDGGTRVPFIARWPGNIKPGSQSDEIISLVDLTATAADIIGYRLPDDAAEDSHSILPVLQGRALTEPIREATITHSVMGEFAIRTGRWKFLDCVGSGGWSGPGDGLPGQLYDMVADPGEQNNLYESPDHQPIIEELKALLEKHKAQGFSRPMERMGRVRTRP